MDIYKTVDMYNNTIKKQRPFEGRMLEEIKKYYRVSSTWASNALEGNTLTESETKIILEDGLTIGGKPLKDIFEAIGHAEAYDYMFSLLNHKTITEKDILKMHSVFFKNIDEQYAGEYRDVEVVITGSKFPVAKAEDIPKKMDALCEWIAIERGSCHPVEFAAQLHKKLVIIHPFIDGNGRIARLLMNTALIQDGYLPAVIPPVLRRDYIDAIEEARINDRLFNRFIAERVLESHKEIAKLLHIPIIK